MSSELVGAKQACISECTPRQMTVMEQLEDRRERAVKQLEEVDSAIAVFKEHPEVEKALTALARVGIYR